MKASIQRAAQWFEEFPGATPGTTRLFCFPYAGGSAQVFRGWQRYFSPDMTLWLTHLPGRGMRIGESPFTKLSRLVAELADAITPHTQTAFAFWGHSMGALIGFELARELQRRNQGGPVALFVSGRGAPHDGDLDPPTFSLPDAEFIEELRRLNGTPEALLESAESRELFLPIIRADFELVETYIFEPGPLLECPIHAYGGLEDIKVPVDNLQEWKEQTALPSSCNVRMFPGDHFFLHDCIADLAAALRRDLLQVLPASCS